MIAILLISLLLVLFPSCSPDSSSNEREIYLISVADDADASCNKKVSADSTKTVESRKLETVISDQASLISQISLFGNTHIYSFTSQDGKRYVSKDKLPKFMPYDSSGKKLDSPSDSTFNKFRYVPGENEEESEWTMKDVLKTINEIDCGENDLVIFTYSGHGETNTGALITNARFAEEGETWEKGETKGGTYENPKLMYLTTTVDEILTALSSISGKKVMFLDSCYSGNFVVNSTLPGKDTFSGGEAKFTGEDYIEGLKKSSFKSGESTYPSLWIMASATKNQTASDSINEKLPFQSYYGAFTYYLLKALGFNMDENTAGKGSSVISFYSIYSYVRANFPSDHLVIQTPRASLKRLDIRIR